MPVVYKKTYNTAGVAQEQMLYLHRDYQGSILAITDANAVVLEKRQFDAWGSLINYYNASGAPFGGWGAFDRGYTGHEHLQSVGLINMNGRLYDPKLHRFLQPDNYVQDPSNTQNYNRYGYVLNNPLKYTDPSGEITDNCPTCPDVANNNGFEGGYEGQGGANIFKSVAEFFKNPENGEWLRRNAGEAGRFIGRNVASVGNFIGKNVGSFFKGLFGGGHKDSGPPPNMATNVNMNPYNNGGSNSFGQGNSNMLSNMWNSPIARIFPDRIGFSVSSSVTWLFGMSDSINFDWITRGNDGSFLPYITSTTGGYMGLGTDSLVPTADALFSPTIGWYNSLDLRQLPQGEVSNGLLGYSGNANLRVEDGLAGSVGGSLGFAGSAFQSPPTWFSINAGIGIGSPNASVNAGASYTYPWHIFYFKN